ncbi:MAG TPA: hypothetical protein VLJ11_04075 [Bryobacteraceae bacterium]|nr:hypothetical protein [Bryobacteraceae bacterium]
MALSIGKQFHLFKTPETVIVKIRKLSAGVQKTGKFPKLSQPYRRLQVGQA